MNTRARQLSSPIASRRRPAKMEALVWPVLAFVTICWAISCFVFSGSTWYAAGIVLQVVAIHLALLVARVLSGRRIRAVSGLSIVLVSHTLLFVLRPWYAITYADARNHFSGAADDPWSFQAQLLAAIGLLAVGIGWGIASRPSNGRAPELLRGLAPLQPIGAANWARIRPWLLIFGSVGVALWALQIFSLGWGNYWSLTFSGRSEGYWDYVRETSGYVTAGPRFALGASLLFLIKSLVDRRQAAVVAWGIATAILCIPLLSAGSRSSFLPVVFFVLLFVARWNPRLVSAGRLFIALPVIFILGFVAPRLWRVDLSATGGSALDSVASALDPNEFAESFLGGLDTAMLDSFVLQVQAQAEGLIPLLFGSTYAGGLLSFVPRSIWESKPVSVDETLNATLLPEYLDRGTGIAYGFYSEPYLNLGVLGVILVPLTLGAVLGWLTRQSEDSPSVLWTYWYALFSGFTFVFMRGNLSFDLQRFFMWALPVLFALAASRVVVVLSRDHQIASVRNHSLRTSAPHNRRLNRDPHRNGVAE